MSISTSLHFAEWDGDILLQVTDGDLLASFEVRNPQWDWQSHGITCDVSIDGQPHQLLILSGFRLQLVRPGGVAPTWADLLERCGHPMGEGVPHD